MFVYQNANRDICVTFESNKPVDNPEYVISIDHESGTISVNGEVVEAVPAEPEMPVETEQDTGTETPPVEEPEVPVEDNTEAEED